MDLVTLTDHDTIAGGLELLDRPDFFLSEEITTVFPEDGCAIHVLAWNITPAQHDRLQQARVSVYNLVEVLRREHIVHACAHPLFSPNSRLTVAALERILVLFPVLEGVNGLTDRRLEADLRGLLAGVDSATLDELSLRHGLARSWQGAHVLTAGSDDHVTRRCGSCFMQVDGPAGPTAFLDAVQAGGACAIGTSADLATMQLAASRVTYAFLAERQVASPGYQDAFVDLIDTIAGHAPRDATGSRRELIDRYVAGAVRTGMPLGTTLEPSESPSDADDRRVTNAMSRTLDGLLGRALEDLYASAVDVDVYRLLAAVRDLGAAVATALPLVLAARHFAKQRQHAAQVLAQWGASTRAPRTKRLAIFSDTLAHVDGVSTSIQRFVDRATREGCEVRVPYCGTAPPSDCDQRLFIPLESAMTFETALYSGLELHVPSLPGTLDWLWRNDITHLELATPGPMGLAGLIAARVMQLPVVATFHTELAALVPHLTSHRGLAATARSLTRWFYRAVDTVVAFSESARTRLLELGVPAERVRLVATAVDPSEFTPQRARHDAYRAFGLDAPHERIVLTVGRLSPEKNIRTIIDAIEHLQAGPNPPVLAVVGDGPQRQELEARCANKDFVVFLGEQRGDVLKELYASASAFAFASQIDTLGLAAMEAMTSGVPIIVPNGSAIAEIVRDSVHGYVYDFGVDGLARAIASALQCQAKRAIVAENARNLMLDRWARAPFHDHWDLLVS
jgi:glycosyltransferase involved in cell wall biosynthesis